MSAKVSLQAERCNTEKRKNVNTTGGVGAGMEDGLLKEHAIQSKERSISTTHSYISVNQSLEKQVPPCKHKYLIHN